MRIDLREDPAVMQMAEITGMNEICVVGYCHAIWSWLSRQCHAGSVTGVTLLSLGRVTQTGDFPIAMQKVGWLDEQTIDGVTTLVVPNFERHLSQSAKRRALAADRQSARRHAAVTEVSRTERDEMRTREEKRREENKEDKRVRAALPPSRKSAKGNFSPDDLELPFASDQFAAAWRRWCQHRREKRKPLTPTAADAQLEEFAEWGEARAIAAIAHTIRKGWQGIREPDGNDRPSRPSQLDYDAEMAAWAAAREKGVRS